jgi:hypothetical protein
MTHEYTIDTCNALITKVGKMYKVDTTSPNLADRFCNDSAVSNVEYFKTIKECKAHVDMLSITNN